MARVYKTARGKSVDMDKVKLSNENTNAVGNMRVNARGDVLGAGGQVAVGRNKIMDRVYAVPSAPTPSAGYSPVDNTVQNQQQQAVVEATKAEIAQTVNTATETTTTTAPTTRGSLASTVKK